MRYPGVVLGTEEMPHPALLRLVTTQLKLPPPMSADNWAQCWAEYGQREQTRREHLAEIQAVFGFQPFTMRHYQPAVKGLDDLAWQTDKGVVLAAASEAVLEVA